MDLGDLKLPEEKRPLFKIHLGTFIEEKSPGYPEKIVKERIKTCVPPLVITVGDVCTEKLIASGIIPNIAITDERTTRHSRTPITVPDAVELRATNPPGMITREAWMVIQEAITRLAENITPIHLRITGEEDLLTIPAVLEAPTKAFVIYGQPDLEGRTKRGLVYIEVSDEIKRRAKGFIALMEKPAP